MQAVEELGHGSAHDQIMNVDDSLAELLATGLGRRDGIHQLDWERTAGGVISMESFLEGLCIDGLKRQTESFQLEESTLNILDSILPFLYLHLMNKLYNNKKKINTP
jgi:hypothetical protein